MLSVTDQINIPETEISFKFIHASGPGGQNVNKVSSAVQLRFDVRHSPSLPDEVRDRLSVLAGNRLTDDGFLIIDARRYREQSRNRQDALNCLADMIRQASKRPKTRRKTKPTAASRRRLREAKIHRSRLKRDRRKINGFE